ncbi:MAG: MoxR family ATPase [Verrucomicrobiales bacterium]|nr:MoxR family ATPase [Verrucomicrobiales bacterium]
MDAPLRELQAHLNRSVLGAEAAVEELIAALLAGGHVLIEGPPGVGKTTLAKSLSAAIHGEFRRVQFTPDLLPADLVGYSIYRQDKGEFEFIEGPVFANLLLADEINRASPRIQSALLECMNEGQVTTDGVTRSLPPVFTVIATRNNRHSAGTFPLPAPQLDRFLVSIEMSLPDRETRANILLKHANDPSPATEKETPSTDDIPSLDLAQVEAWQKKVRDIPVSKEISHYVVRLCDAVRTHPELNTAISNRGAISLMRLAQAFALLSEHPAVYPDDVKRAFLPTLFHRIQRGEEDYGQDESNRRAAALRLHLADLRDSVSVE